MSKMTDTSCHHRNTVLVSLFYRIFVPNTAAWLDDGFDIMLSRVINAVVHWEEGITGHDGASKVVVLLGLGEG